MERLELDEEDYARIESLAEAEGASALLELLAPDQRDAVRLHVMEERAYDDIARSLHTTESVVRKRVSRGLAAVRRRMGAERMSEDFVTRLRLQLREAAERDARGGALAHTLRDTRSAAVVPGPGRRMRGAGARRRGRCGRAAPARRGHAHRRPDGGRASSS